MISRFLREQAWWRLNSAGVSALRIARNAVALLDAAAYVADLPGELGRRDGSGLPLLQPLAALGGTPAAFGGNSGAGRKG